MVNADYHGSITRTSYPVLGTLCPGRQWLANTPYSLPSSRGVEYENHLCPLDLALMAIWTKRPQATLWISEAKRARCRVAVQYRDLLPQ